MRYIQLPHQVKLGFDQDHHLLHKALNFLLHLTVIPGNSCAAFIAYQPLLVLQVTCLILLTSIFALDSY